MFNLNFVSVFEFVCFVSNLCFGFPIAIIPISPSVVLSFPDLCFLSLSCPLLYSLLFPSSLLIFCLLPLLPLLPFFPLASLGHVALSFRPLSMSLYLFFSTLPITFVFNLGLGNLG